MGKQGKPSRRHLNGWSRGFRMSMPIEAKVGTQCGLGGALPHALVPVGRLELADAR